MNKPIDNPPAFPRFFVHTVQVESDAMIVRHDSKYGEAVVITNTGKERTPNSPFPWVLSNSLLMVSTGKAMEITKAQADLLSTRATQKEV